MKSSLVRAALACVALALTTTAAFAGIGDPIQGVPVGLEGDPGQIVVAHGVTDDKGQVSFGDLKPGKYRIVINADALNPALKKLDPKGLAHTIVVTFGLAGQKPIAASSVPETFPIAASLRVGVIVTDPTDTVGNMKTKEPHHYVGIVSLVK